MHTELCLDSRFCIQDIANTIMTRWIDSIGRTR